MAQEPRVSFCRPAVNSHFALTSGKTVRERRGSLGNAAIPLDRMG